MQAAHTRTHTHTGALTVTLYLAVTPWRREKGSCTTSSVGWRDSTRRASSQISLRGARCTRTQPSRGSDHPISHAIHPGGCARSERVLVQPLAAAASAPLHSPAPHLPPSHAAPPRRASSTQARTHTARRPAAGAFEGGRNPALPPTHAHLWQSEMESSLRWLPASPLPSASEALLPRMSRSASSTSAWHTRESNLRSQRSVPPHGALRRARLPAPARPRRAGCASGVRPI